MFDSLYGIQAPDPFTIFSAFIRLLKMMPMGREMIMMAKMVRFSDCKNDLYCYTKIRIVLLNL